jgi:hypothetical protein
VARGVCQITRSKGESHDGYGMRMLYGSDAPTELAKLGDVTHNLSTIGAIADPVLREKAVRNKIHQCEQYYLPLALQHGPQVYERIHNAVEKARELLM